MCLSGGGYRAMLFHLGCLWRLNELNYLPRFTRISSVSGGSITSGVLAMNWAKLEFDGNGYATKFDQVVTQPLRRIAGKTIDAPSLFEGFVEGASKTVAKHYKDYLFGDTTLQNLPDEPLFIFNSTSMKTGVLWRFSKPYMGDYKVGIIKNPTVPLARAVAASSAFPPILSPAVFDLDPASFDTDPRYPCKAPFNTAEYRSQAVLCDGGVYDNFGMETAWKNCAQVIVSDGGGALEMQPNPSHLWPQQTMRVLNTIYNQVAALRKRVLIASYQLGERTGTFWSVQTNIADYSLRDALVCDFNFTTTLAQTATRLDAMDDTLQKQLIDWGYAVCDAGMRKWVIPGTPGPDQSPYGTFHKTS
jgi:NTE family protein